jgi:hypothetical protein
MAVVALFPVAAHLKDGLGVFIYGDAVQEGRPVILPFSLCSNPATSSSQ